MQQSFHEALVTARTTYAAWHSRPSFYAVSTEDRTINPDLSGSWRGAWEVAIGQAATVVISVDTASMVRGMSAAVASVYM